MYLFILGGGGGGGLIRFLSNDLAQIVPLLVHTTVSRTRSDIDGALRRANSTEYGLASGVFTKDISKVGSTLGLYSDYLFGAHHFHTTLP